MRHKATLSDIWIKASILGAIWASSEIVFGSFLHNLRIPFSGNVLTGIGLIILISFSYFWTDRGLYWRAGLITALLKTMSPSAVIFGPMIAIFAESLLLEIFTRIFGRNVLGYLLGASLAMSWNLVQKIINLIIFYGYNIVELYSKLVDIAGSKLNIHSDNTWLPVLIILLLYFLFGLFAGLLGIRTGRSVKKMQKPESLMIIKKDKQNLLKNSKLDFNYSLKWFYANLLLIAGSLLLLSLTSWKIWIIVIPLIVIVWTARYKRALRQIARPKFWIYFVVITSLITLVFSKETSIAERLLIGLQMNYRAAVIISGFTVMGTELYNPRIREFFRKSVFKELSVAIEISYESLPYAISNIPNIKTLFRNPAIVISSFLSLAEERLSKLKERDKKIQRVFIITGSVGEGKTTFIKKIISKLTVKNISIEGIYSERIVEKNNTIGYDIVNIKSNDRTTFLRTSGQESFERIGKYYIYPEGINRGNEILNNIRSNNFDLVIIDEISRLELNGKGWAVRLKEILTLSIPIVLITVRDDFVEEVKMKFGIEDAEVFDVSEYDAEDVLMKLDAGLRD